MSPATVGTVIAGLCLAGVVTGSTRGDADDTATAAPAERGTSDAARFYGDAKVALEPLLADARLLSALQTEVGAGAKPQPPVSGLAAGWAERFADAARRVKAVAPASAPWSEEVQGLYGLGASVYVEAAHAVQRMVAVADDPGQRQEAWKTVGRLQVLGDRLFDAGTRLLGDREVGEPGIIVERTFPPAVPDFSTGPLRAEPASPQITSGAGTLERLANRPGAGAAAREGLHSGRLATLVAGEADRVLVAPPTPGGDPVRESQRLRTIADDLWGIGTRLLTRSGVSVPPLPTLTNGEKS